MKLNKLLPIATLGTIAITIPTITSCSYPTNVIQVEVTDYDTSGAWSENEYDFKAGQLYELSIDISKMGRSEEVGDWVLSLGGGETNNGASLSSTNAKYWQGDVEYGLGAEGSEFYRDDVDEGVYVFKGEPKTDILNKVLKFQFQVDNDATAPIYFFISD